MRIYLDPTQRADLISRAQMNTPSVTGAVIIASVTDGSTARHRPPIAGNRTLRRGAVDVIRTEKK